MLTQSAHPRIRRVALAVVAALTTTALGMLGPRSSGDSAGFDAPRAEAATGAENGPAIDTVAGAVCSPEDDARAVGLEPTAVAPDWHGGFYVADWSHSVVCHVSADGRIEAFAGNGSAGFDGDGGPATDARLYEPTGVSADWWGNVYIADRGNHRIRRVGPDGTIATVAGNGRAGLAGDGGPATEARLRFPAGVTWTPRGELYVADSRNHAVRRVGASGTITTVAGTGAPGFAGDGGPGTEARLRFPTGVSWAWGWLLVADAGNHRIRALGPGGGIHTWAGTGKAAYAGDGGPPAAASFRFPMGVWIDPWAGAVHIADSGNHRVRTVRRGIVDTTLGGDGADFAGDGGPPDRARLDFPNGVASYAGRLWVADRSNHRVRLVHDGVVTTGAGNGTRGFSGDGGPATEAQLFQPTDVAQTPGGDLLIAVGHDHVVRRIDADDGTITVVAGTPGVSAMGLPAGADLGDGGPATEATLGFVTGLAVTDDGTIYVADWAHRVRRVTPDGTIETVAGTGRAGFSGDGGPGPRADLHAPSGLALDADGNLHFADTANNRVRMLRAVDGRVEPTSVIETVAGTGTAGSSGDGGPAAEAQLNWPIDVDVSDAGALYVADHRNHRIRLVENDTISTVAGTGALGYTPEGAPALSSAFNHPASIALTGGGDLLVSDKGNCIIRRITAVGTSDSTVSTIAGWTPVRGVTPVCGFDGDGGSPRAGGTRLFNPLGLHVDDEGNVYVADSLNHRVRAIG